MASNGATSDVMLSGSVMQLLTGPVESVSIKPIFIWWEAGATPSKLGTIYFNDNTATKEKTKVDGQSLPMNKISDVFSGRHQPLFKSAVASGFASEQCFTLGAKTLPLNLVAESAADRTAWINGIKAVFSNGQAAKKAEKAAAAAAVAAAAAPAANGNGNGVAAAEPVAAPAAAAPAPVEAAPVAAAAAAPAAAVAASAAAPSNGTPVVGVTAPNLLAEGHVYRSIVLDSSAPRGATASPIFLWHAPEDGKLGTLYWQPASESQDKTKDPERSMPVAKIRDVMLGRQTAEFKTDFARDLSSNTCFSLMMDKDKGEGLHLIAKDDAERAATLVTIKGFWTQPRKPRTSTAGASPAVTTAAAAAPAPAAETVPAAAAAPVAAAAVVAAAAAPAPAAAPAATSEGEYQAPAPVPGVVRLHLGTAAEDDEPAAAAKPAPVAAASPKASAAPLAVAPASPSVPMSPVNAADKAKAAALTAQVAAEPQRNIDAMLAGALFRSHEVTLAARAPQDIFVFLSQDAPEDGPIGSLYYNDAFAPNQRAKSSERQLALHTTKDIFVGKHAWKKANLVAPEFPSTRALSIVAPQRALHLEAQSDEARARWATGIRNVFEVAHRRAEEAKRAAAAAAASGASSSPSNGDSAAQKSSTEFMGHGSEFTQYYFNEDKTRLLSKPVVLFYVRTADKLGTLFWSEPGRRDMVPDQSIPLHRVSDVYCGKHSSIKERPEIANVRTSNMFTLASRTTSVHLEARDAAHRTAWIESIKGVFTTAGKKVDENKMARLPANFPEVPMSPRNGIEGSSGAASPGGLAREKPLPMVATPIGEGQDFDMWVLSDDGKKARSYPVHVWFERDVKPLGALYWSNTPGQRIRTEDQFMPLNEVSDVFVGKHTDEFKNADAADVPHDRCISLRSQLHPNHNLNLVASSAQAQRRWTRGLKKQFSENPDTVIETRPVRAGETPAEAVASPRAARTIKAKLITLSEGHDVVTVEHGGVQRDVVFWFDQADGRAGTLYWGARGSRAKDAALSIPVHTISDVYQGKKTQMFKQPSAAGILSNTAFSVASKTRQLNAYTRSEADRKAIMQGIEAAIIAAGTPVREYQHGRVPQNGVVTNPGLLAQTAVIQQGARVLWHHTKAQPPRPIFLWYEPQHAKLGAFFWVDVAADGKPQLRNKNPRQQMLLQHVSDVMIARQSAILKVAAAETGASGTNCFSLHTTNGPALDLQLSSRSERDAWLSSVRAIFALTNKRIVEGSGVARSLKLTPGQIVDTFYGRGVVLDAPRQDGITRVEVAGTTCFFNAASIHPAVVLYTPYGRGVVPQDKAQASIRPDGIRRVDLPWATAYLNAESWTDRDPKQLNNMHQTREQSVATLVKGANFLRITSRGTQEPVWVSLVPSQSPAGLGTLEFRTGNAQGGLQGTVALKEMSDLLVGCQTPQLRAQAGLREALALSIVGAAVTVDLVAPTEQARTDWLYALFNMLSTGGRRITAQRGVPGASPQAMAAISPMAGVAARRYSFCKPQIPPFNEAEAFLTRGALFQLLVVRPDGTRESAPSALLFLDSRDDRMYWWPSTESAEANIWRTKYPTRSLDIALIRDLYYNRKTAAFQERAFVGTPREQCMSIGLKDKTEWNLIAVDRDTRDKTFFALQSILTSRERQARLQMALAASAASSSSSAAQWSPRAASGGAASDNLVSRGVMATRWVGEVHPESEPVFVFHEFDGTKYGSLYWNSTQGDRTRASNKCFPLHTVRDVWMGRNTPTTRCAELADIPKACLFSLGSAPPADGSAPMTLNLQIASGKDRAAFVNALKEFWSSKAKSPSSTTLGGVLSPSSAAMANIGTSSSSSSSTGPQAVVPPQPIVRVTGAPLSEEFRTALAASAPRGALLLAPLSAVGLLQTGSTFSKDGGDAIDLFYVGASGFDVPFGSLVMAPVASREVSAEDPAKNIAIHRIERVRVGVEGRSFTIETASQKVQFVSPSLGLVAAWLTGLQYILTASGFRLTQGADGAYNVNDASAINAPTATLVVPAGPATSSVTEQAPNMMVFNALFPTYGSNMRGGVARTPVSLFVEGSSLYVSAPGSRVKDETDESRRFPLAQLTRVSTGGKYGPLAASIQSADNFMDIEAGSQTDLAAFLAGLSAVTLAAGDRSIAQERVTDPAAPAAGLKRSYVISPARKVVRGPTKASTSTPVVVDAPISPASEAAAQAEFASSGATVTAYTLKSSGALLHKDLVLWLGVDESTGAPLINWGGLDDDYVAVRASDPEGDNVLEAEEVLSVQVGKYTPTLQALGDEAATPSALCVSVTSATTNLNFVATSPAQARAIVNAIKAAKASASTSSSSSSAQ